MDVPARAGRDRAVITGSARPGCGRSAKRDLRRKKDQSGIEGVVALTWTAEGNGHTQVAELLRQAVRDTPEAVAV